MKYEIKGMENSFLEPIYQDFLILIKGQMDACGREPALKKRKEHLRQVIKHLIASTKD